LKAMLKKATPDAFHLNGGTTISVETNSARLAKNTIATITLDPTVLEAIASIWWDSEDETREEAAIRAGYTADQVPQLRFIRWLRTGESGVSPYAKPAPLDPGPPEDRDHAAQDRDHAAQDPGPDPAAVARYRKAVEEREREIVNDKLRDGLNKISGGFA
jgi:hypothetical protein